MIKIIWNFIKKEVLNFKTILIIICIILIAVCAFLLRARYQDKNEIKRQERNIIHMNYNIDSLKQSNGDLSYSIHSLQVKKSELIYFNEELLEEIELMEVKLKKASSATKIEYKYIYLQDTTPINAQKINDSTFIASYEDKWIKMKELVAISYDTENNMCVDINKMEIGVNDAIYIISEDETKGWWFWKRIVGVKVHLKSKNPYFNLDRIESIRLEK